MQTLSSQTTQKQSPSSSQKKKSAKEERVNLALRDALYMHSDSQSRWDKLIADGATDAQIWHGLLREFGGGGSSQTEGGDQYSFKGGKGLEQPKFWFSCGTYLTDAKPTFAGARLVNRVRELLQIPSMKTLDDNAANSDASAIQESALDLAFLADLEDEQKGRWATICEYDRLLSDDTTPKRDKKRLRGERKGAQGRYDDVWDDAVKALDNSADIVQDVRDRIEMADGSTISETGDAPEWHEYFEQTPGEGCFLQCGKLETDPIHTAPSTSAESGEGADTPATETTAATPRTFSKEIEVELTDSDYKQKSRQLAFLRVQIEELQAEKKATDDSYKQKIGGLEEQCTELFRTIRRGKDTLELEVFERRDFERKVVELVRADNHTVVDSRAMQPRELQQPLPSI